MAKIKTARRGATAGYRLALALAQEIAGGSGSGCFHFEEAFREGGPQRNAVAEYLERVRLLGDPEAEAGFSAMLTEFIASGIYGAFPSDVQKYYRDVLREKARLDAARSDSKFQSFVQVAMRNEVRHG